MLPRLVVITSVHPRNKKAPFVAVCVSTRPAKESDEPIFPLPWVLALQKFLGRDRKVERFSLELGGLDEPLVDDGGEQTFTAVRFLRELGDALGKSERRTLKVGLWPVGVVS